MFAGDKNSPSLQNEKKDDGLNTVVYHFELQGIKNNLGKLRMLYHYNSLKT
jgi:hypothetical protein